MVKRTKRHNNRKNTQPWSPADATERLRTKANDPAFDVGLTQHAKDQMNDREIYMSDVIHVLKNGFVTNEAQPAKNKGWYKYCVECSTPNSGRRSIRVVIIPQQTPAVALITVMWADEK